MRKRRPLARQTTYGIFESIVASTRVVLGDEFQTVATRSFGPLDTVNVVLGQRFYFAGS